MLIKNIFLNLKTLKKNKIMIWGIHYFITEIKTKYDVIPRSRFKIPRSKISAVSAIHQTLQNAGHVLSGTGVSHSMLQATVNYIKLVSIIFCANNPKQFQLP